MGTLSSFSYLLYEDTGIFVLNKPSGLHSVSLPGKASESMAALLTRFDPSLAEASEKPTDGGLVQRLDQGTSGVLLGAKHRAAWERLRNALHAGKMQKSYLIITEGAFPEVVELDTFIGTPNRRARKVKVYTSKPEKSARALPASTRFERLRFDSALDISLVRAHAPTARRHQVRAHAAFCKHPLLGDSLYGAQRAVQDVAPAHSSPPYLLHAESLSFLAFDTGKLVTVRAPLPPAFENLFPNLPEALREG